MNVGVRLSLPIQHLGRTGQRFKKISWLDLRYDGTVLQGGIVIANPVDRLISSFAKAVYQYV